MTVVTWELDDGGPPQIHDLLAIQKKCSGEPSCLELLYAAPLDVIIDNNYFLPQKIVMNPCFNLDYFVLY